MISRSLADTEQAAKAFVEALLPRPHGATVVALSGDLGAGKTTFVKSVAASLGIPEADVTSPTFVIQKTFPTPSPRFPKLVHIDAYRIEHPEEMRRLGFDEALADPHALILVEWPEKLAGLLPGHAITASFRFIDENTREIVFN